MNKLSFIKGLLIDLDGVVQIGEKPVEGAEETIRHLKSKGILCRFTTNTTTRSTESVHAKLRRLGMPVEKNEIVSAPYAGVLYLRSLGKPRCFFLLSEDARLDFAEFPESESDPEVVVLGDIGDRWNYFLLNRVFQMLMTGAELVALHKGRYWQVEDGLRMDIGAFVAGLEYVTGKQATVIGKPSESFFRLALADLGLPAKSVAVIGDDIDSDVGGAQKIGLTGILVRTGKYRDELVACSPVEPDLVLDSIWDLKKMKML